MIFNAIIWSLINFLPPQLIYTKTGNKQPMPNNFWQQIFHYFLKQTITSQLTNKYPWAIAEKQQYMCRRAYISCMVAHV